MADSQTGANPPVAPTVPVSALDRKRPEDQATAAVVAANQRATTLDSVKSPAELTVFVSCTGNQSCDSVTDKKLDRQHAGGSGSRIRRDVTGRAVSVVA